jgi:FkbH-like protein
MKDKPFVEILRENKILADNGSSKPKVDVKVLSNITLNQLAPILEYKLRVDGIHASVTIGEYDNILQESATIVDRETCVIVMWELCNLKESFAFEIEQAEGEYFEKYLTKVKSELQLLFHNLSNSRLVLFNSFSHLSNSHHSINQNNYERFVNELNLFLNLNLPANFILVNLDKVIAKVSIEATFDWRGYYSAKMLYSVAFLKEFSIFISPVINSLFGKAKKVLVFDCDNTLWKGIVGEDGMDNVGLSDSTIGGKYFYNVHLIAKSLMKRGVILCICSKNNEQDVADLFLKRTDSILKYDYFVVKKINWENKAKNLSEIALELNVGIDSLVFVDDSKFEINLIKEILPNVETIEVPTRLYEYPSFFQSHINYFYSFSKTTEDGNRTKMYLENLDRSKHHNSMQNIEEYLSSLEIKLQLSNKNKTNFERLIQLTQKTNQFNLTTKRYGIGDMEHFYSSDEYDVIDLEVEDRFGKFGVTGLCIIQYTNERKAIIDTLLLSCRILGRKIEQVFIQEIIKHIKERGCTLIQSTYTKTNKNVQVENYYLTSGFIEQSKSSDQTFYVLDLSSFLFINENNYIQTTWKQN